MIVALIGLIPLVGIFFYEYRVIKDSGTPKTLSFIGWRPK